MWNFVWYPSTRSGGREAPRDPGYMQICSEPSKVGPRDDQYGDLERDRDGDRVGLGDFRPVPPPGGSDAYTR